MRPLWLDDILGGIQNEVRAAGGQHILLAIAAAQVADWLLPRILVVVPRLHRAGLRAGEGSARAFVGGGDGGHKGIRSILEHVLLNLMYELPSYDNVSKVVVDEASVLGKSDPLIVYDETKTKKVSSS